MISLDTNVLVRYLVEDDARQAALAASLIERVIKENERLFVSDVVICETVWVLSAAYEFGRAEIADTLRDVLRARHLVFAEPDQLTHALAAFAAGQKS